MTVVRCVGAIVFDGDGRLLLIRRGHAPAEGRWSIPGGRVEPGESDHDAVVRELAEETGLVVVPGVEAGSVLRPGAGGPGAPGGSVLRPGVGGPGAPGGSVLEQGPGGPGVTDPVVYEIHDYACEVAGDPTEAAAGIAAAVAGDDAADLRWVGHSELAELDAARQLTDGLWETLAEWGRLPAPE